MQTVNLRKIPLVLSLVACCLCVFTHGLNWQLPPAQISAPQLPTRDVQVAADDAGNIVAVWTQAQDSADTANGRGVVYGSRYTAGVWSDPFVISKYPNGDVYSDNSHPQVVIVNDDGKAVVAYQNGNYSLNLIYVNHDNTVDHLANSGDIINNYDGGRFSLAKYKLNQAILVWATKNQDKIRLVCYDGSILPGSSASINVTANSPGGSDTGSRQNPFVAMQPGTGIPFVVYTEKVADGSSYYQVTGVPIQSLIDPCRDSYYTVFSQYNCVDGALNFPQILFNPADNTPVVFFARKAAVSGQASIVAALWKPIFVLSGDDPQYIDLYNTISTAELSDNHAIRFSAVSDASNYFKVVYTQNTSPYFTYGAAYIPHSDSDTNDQISTAGAVSFNNIPAMVKANNATNTNIVLWEQNNKLFGASYTPGSTISRYQISSDGSGLVIKGLALGIDTLDSRPVAVWNQGVGPDNTQVFAAIGSLTDGAVTWGTSERISEPTDMVSEVEIATDNDTTVIAVWTQNQLIYASRLDLTTTPKQWGVPFQVSKEGLFDNSIPHVVIVSPGKAVVTYKHIDGSTNTLHVRYIFDNDDLSDDWQFSNEYDGDSYSIAKYKNNQAVIVWANQEDQEPHDNITIIVYDGDDTVNAVQIANEDVGNAPRRHPFVAVHPGTGMPMVLYVEKVQSGDGWQVTGVPVPWPNAPADKSKYTRFSPGKCVEGEFNFPQVVFDPQDNTPTVLFGYKENTPAFIASSRWSPIYSSPDDPQDIYAYEPVSDQPLVTTDPLKFRATVDGNNYFKLVYTQNISPFETFGTKITLTGSPANNLIGTTAANYLNTPQLVSLNQLIGSDYTNLVQWEQNNKVFAGTYTPTNNVTDGQQLSADSDGTTIYNLSLGIASDFTVPIAVWVQGDSSGQSQVYGTYTTIVPTPQPTPPPNPGPRSIRGNPLSVVARKQIQTLPGCCNIINVLTWPPSANASQYRIFLWPDITTPLTIVGAQCPLLFKHYCRACNVPNIYVVDKVDVAGNISDISIVKIPG